MSGLFLCDFQIFKQFSNNAFCSVLSIGLTIYKMQSKNFMLQK